MSIALLTATWKALEVTRSPAHSRISTEGRGLSGADNCPTNPYHNDVVLSFKEIQLLICYNLHVCDEWALI